MSSAPLRVEVDGHPATVKDLRPPALVNYGHFTSMQVRNGRARGLYLHLRRLASATKELFNVALNSDLVLDHIRHALGSNRDASVRVSVFWPETGDTPGVMVAVRPPADMPIDPQRLQSVPYQRPVPHLKHTGGFAQVYYATLAEQDGFDDALLTGPDGEISETTMSNIAFHEGDSINWPTAPALPGITMQLLEQRLAATGLPTGRAPVRLADLTPVTSAFVTNSYGVAPVGSIDNVTLTVDTDLMKIITEAYESIPLDEI